MNKVFNGPYTPFGSPVIVGQKAYRQMFSEGTSEHKLNTQLSCYAANTPHHFLMALSNFLFSRE